MRLKRKTTVLLAAVVVVVAGCGYAVGTVANSRPRSVHGFCSEMPDAVGLYTGNPVTQMGYTVGRVDRIVPAGDHVEVGFSLDSNRKYPSGVKVVTRSKSLLADRSLEIVGNYSSGPELTPGHCTALDRSYTPKSISQIAGSASDFINAVAPADGKQSVRNALGGLAAALQGNGRDAAGLMRNAASAMSSPDRMISDFGTSIMNMAPMTRESLQRWSTIRSLFDQLPAVAQAANDELLPGAHAVTTGTGYLLKVLLDIQRNYADIIWPTLQVGVSSVVHMAATHSKDLAGLLGTLPPVAQFMRQQAAPGGPTVTLAPPVVRPAPGAPVPAMSLLDLVLAKKGSR